MRTTRMVSWWEGQHWDNMVGKMVGGEHLEATAELVVDEDALFKDLGKKAGLNKSKEAKEVKEAVVVRIIPGTIEKSEV